jgi:hypothetical protein
MEMRKLTKVSLIAAAIVWVGLPGSAEASSITCPGAATSPERQMTLGDATACYFGTSTNPSAATVAGHLGGTWTNEGGVVGGPGTNDLLTIALTSGSFGSIPAAGTWAIAPAFWATYGRAAISVHVGQGGGNPDYWVFEILPGSLNGTWSLALLSGTGGGLSNMKLWGSGAPNGQVPEPASMLLLGAGLVLVAARLRRRAARK